MEYLLITGILLVLSLVMTLDFSWNNVLTTVRNQLVFEGRNQAYGAFVLRRDYVKRLMMAVGGSVAFFGLAIGTPKIIEALGGGEEEVVEAKKIVDVNLELFEEEKKEEPPPPPVEVPPPPKIETVQFTALEAVDEPVEEPPPTQEVLEETTASTVTQEGEKGEDAPPPPPPVEEEVMMFAAVEEKPTFPGGEAEFYKYLGKNVKYPQMEAEQGIEGRVFVEFVVDKDGSITEVRTVRGVSAGLDKEATRVMKASPKWSPGKQNGRPVKVRYVIPINFDLR
ncbi:MAG: TonB family protein [Flavobacteriales bacterium]|nr:TonB family protein [Flavobacteriales bacterium]